MSIDFTDKVAIVTGAGGGLGRCHALELAKRGARVVVNDLGGSVDGSGGDQSAAQQVVDEIKAMGGDAVANGASVTDEQAVNAMIEQTMAKFGRIDILINNAGILRDKSFAKMSLDDYRLVVDVHLMGSVYCTKAVWPIMTDQAYGRVVMTTSPSGLYGNFGQTNYGAAKLGLVGFMNSLKIEGLKYNIRVNAISPVAATRMTENLIPEEVLATLGPELITPAVVYLASEQAPSGAIVQAQGGTYSVATIMENTGVDIGPNATADDIAERWSDISDLSRIRPRGKEVFQ